MWKEKRQYSINYCSLTENEKNCIHKRSFFNIFRSRSQDFFKKNSINLKKLKFLRRTIFKTLNAVLKFLPETSWHKSDNIPLNSQKNEEFFFCQGNFLSRISPREIWIAALTICRKKCHRSDIFRLNTRGWKAGRFFFLKSISPRNIPIGR